MRMESVDNRVSNGQMLDFVVVVCFSLIDSNYKEAV